MIWLKIELEGVKFIKDKILVVGGYGNVGQVICSHLAERFPGKIIVAGRSYDKADNFSKTTTDCVLPMKLNVAENHENSSFLDEVFLVIMCLDQKNIRFIETCIRAGIHYIDITASYKLLSDVEAKAELAEQSGSTTVLSVGLAPGISNLLVKHCKQQLGKLDAVDIFILLGMGDEHGKVAIEWTVDNINTTYTVTQNGSLKEVRSFENGKETFFSEKLGKRTAYRFDFADQHVLPRTLDLKTVSTWLCFDSIFFTRFFAILKKLGVLNLLKVKSFRNLFVKIFESFHLGSDIFAVKVDAFGQKGGERAKYQYSVEGHKVGLITGKVAGLVAEKIYTGSYPSGVYHIEELFEPEEILQELEKIIEVTEAEQ